MPNHKKFCLEDSFTTPGSHWMPHCTSNMADRVTNESFRTEAKDEFCVKVKNNEFYEEKDTPNNVIIFGFRTN